MSETPPNKNAGNSDSEKTYVVARDTNTPLHDNEADRGDATTKPLLTKTTSNQPSLSVPSWSRRARSQSPDTLSLISADDFSELRRVQSSSSALNDAAPTQEAPSKGFKGKFAKAWYHNKGLVWVVCGQAFGVLMNVSTRLLEGKENGGMHPFQILFARMSITSILAMLYMYFTSTPDFPLGAKGVRWILVARGMGGFIGVFGLYSSLQYLALADATVITFLAPLISCWVCSKILHESFTRMEQAGGVLSMIGVVLIARPTTLFSQESSSGSAAAKVGSASNAASLLARAINTNAQPSPHQRLVGVGMALIGVCGSTVAYTTIRWIGKRAHPLISVNYFAVWCTIVSTVALVFLPSVPFVLPSTVKQWSLLFLIGLGGFVMQFLITAGLRYEKGSRATNMVYTQMLFALAADKIIWDDVPGFWSLAGSGLILGSALVIAVQKSGVIKSKEAESGTRDEEAAITESVVEASQGVENLDRGRRIMHASAHNTDTNDDDDDDNDDASKSIDDTPESRVPAGAYEVEIGNESRGASDHER